MSQGERSQNTNKLQGETLENPVNSIICRADWRRDLAPNSSTVLVVTEI